MATGCCGVKKPKLLANCVVDLATANSSSGSCCNNSNHQCHEMLTNGLPGGSASRCVNGRSAMSSSMVAMPTSELQAAKSADGGRARVISLEMVMFCFDVLYSYLHNTESPKAPKFSNDHFPLFVTWKLGKDKKLRGCIGTFNSTSLHQGLREYAVTSACKDSRFDPISTDEFGRLHCSVSLLMDFEVAEHYLDWEIGIHGIRIEFNTEKGSKKAATYLPEVAIEQGWNQIQTIDSLLRKGGFKGAITAEVRASLCLIRFQSEKMTVSYQEYRAHKSSPQFGRVGDECGVPSETLISNGGDVEMNDRGGISGTGTSSSRHYGHHHVHGGSCASWSPNGVANGTAGGGLHFQSRLSSSSNAGGRHSLSRHRSSSTGGRYSPTIQRDSHHPSAKAARYLPLPNHPYMPLPPPL